MKIFCLIISIVFFINTGMLIYSVKKKKRIKIILTASVYITIFLAVIGFAELIDLLKYQGLFQFMGLVSSMLFLASALYLKKNLKPMYFAIKMILIAAALELTLFNLPSYRLLIGTYEQRTYPASYGTMESELSSFDESGSAISPENDWIILAFKDLNIPIRNLHVDLNFTESNGVCDYVIDAKDETYQGDYRYDIGRNIITAKNSDSQYMTLELSGNVSDIRIKIRNAGAGSVEVKNVTFNPTIPLKIYNVRFLFLVLVSTFIYVALKGTYLKRSFKESEKICRIISVTAAAVCCITTLFVMNYKLGDTSWSELIQSNGGNQVSKELVEAFENGHTYLDAQPDESLLNMSDPYDRGIRDSTAPYAWDHVLYNGKYYSYYGIAPVILLFLPFHKLTTHYCPNELAVLIFSALGFFGLALVFYKTVKKWFADINIGIYTSSLIMLLVNCGIWFSIGRPDFYEVAIASGFAFVTWGAYFLLSANIIGEGKISLTKTAVSSLLMAISVLCRPTLVLYCICAAIFMILAVRRSCAPVKNSSKKSINKRNIAYLLCALIPMILIGSIQMWYNNARFDSPFEFGIQYSLTINNFTKAQFHPSLSWIALYNYLFNPPVFSIFYPQVSAVFQSMQVNGFFYHDESITFISGFMWMMPPILAYLLSFRALKKIDNRRNKISTAFYIAVPCIIIPVGIIASVWESGYTARYMADFAWQLSIGAFAVLFFLYIQTKNSLKKHIIQYFLYSSLVYVLIVSGVQIFNFIFQYREYHYDFPEMRYMLDSLFAFWK